MTHSVDDANAFILRLLTTHRADDMEGYERAYFDALATSDPSRPLFRIINLLVAQVISDTDAVLNAHEQTADALLRDALEGVEDPGFPTDESDPK